MTFLNPWMLLGGLAVGIPLAMHFFYRAHYKPLPWAAMKFLRLSVEQTSRRLRFQELLLLILRALVCLILALALARPASKSLTAGGGRGESVDAIIVIDTSYSMNANETEKETRLDQAKKAAIKVIDNLPPNSTVQIISCASKATNVGPRSPSNLDQARHRVQDLKTSSLSTDYLDGFNEAVAAFDKVSGASKEVYLIADMQRSGWERQATAVRSKCEEIKNQASLYLVRCGEQKIKNVAVTGILPQTEIPHVDSVTAFTVLLKNSGSNAVENLTLTLEVDGQKEFQKDSVAINRVEAGETRAVTITGKIDHAGWRLLTARINDDAGEKKSEMKVAGKGPAPRKDRANQDGLEEDNVFSLLIQVHEKIRVLVVDGAYNDTTPTASGSFFIANVLLPVPEEKRNEYYVAVSLIRPDNANADSLTDQDICFLVNVDAKQLGQEFNKSLHDFVRSGKGLFIASGSNIKAADYNAAFGDLLPAPLLEEETYRTPKDQPAAADLNSVDVYSFLAKLKEKGNHPLRFLNDKETETEKMTPVADPRSAANKQELGRVLMRFNNDRPMLLSKSVGAGEVLFFTTTVDNTWSNLCGNLAFLPFINGCVAQMIQRSGAVYNRVAGETLKWAPHDSRKEYYVIRPDGEREFLGKKPIDTSRAGVYTIVVGGPNESEGERFVFNPDLAESDNLESITDEQIDTQLGFQPVHLKTGFDGSSFTGTERSRNEWTIWVLTALLFFALGETLWAWFCGRSW